MQLSKSKYKRKKKALNNASPPADRPPRNLVDSNKTSSKIFPRPMPHLDSLFRPSQSFPKVLQEFHTNTTSDLEERLQPIDNRSLAVAGPLLPVWISDGWHQQTCAVGGRNCWAAVSSQWAGPGRLFPQARAISPPWLAPKANIA